MTHDALQPSDTFVHRHIGPTPKDIETMLQTLGIESLEELATRTIPADIRLQSPLRLSESKTEFATANQLLQIASTNRVLRSFIGMGYSDTITPPVILRNVLENPGYYTQYTPYQAEISQGRLEALINFQTMVADLCGMSLANASLLDEGTAAAEAMTMCHRIGKTDRKSFFVAEDCHPQTIAVVVTRARALGLQVTVGNPQQIDWSVGYFGLLLAYPATDGSVQDFRSVIAKAHTVDTVVAMVTDLLFLTLFASPGELGADVAVGSSQRFGVPLGYGGPHAAFLATDEKHSRFIPGRIIGASRDTRGKPAFRLALQTREQHIRRDRATSNICTAQVLLAIVASMYAVYHGPRGLKRIATRVRGLTHGLKEGLSGLGFDVGPDCVFDTLRVREPAKANRGNSQAILSRALSANMNLRSYPNGDIGIALDETTTQKEVSDVLAVFAGTEQGSVGAAATALSLAGEIPGSIRRTTTYLEHPVFNTYASETDMLRYIRKLESRDLSLTTSMIPLGSCTMKLNATSEMLPISWPTFNRIHPFAPDDQVPGYATMVNDLETWLSEITGFAATSLQPNAGAQGEYAGLLVIRAYHDARGDSERDVCLIPISAHGTNPASASLAGMRVVIVACDENGNVDLRDLEAKAAEHRAKLSCLMITYPSTHGVFEEKIRAICEIVHSHGGQVYLDGANMNAQVGLCRPGDFGADVCHLNLHKTFCIPHGGGGPGMGPICVAKHLAPYLPMHPLLFGRPEAGSRIGPISAAPNGSASILPIPWMYIALMGRDGLTKATQVAILNANYMAKRLEKEFAILYRGANGFVAHEFIVDCRPFKKSAGIEVEDIAKRLIDYGFHAPTMSFPVPGTLMIEPTESEPLAELDRFCEALLSIRQEIREIEEGKLPKTDNPLKNAPHTADVVTQETWSHPYSRKRAAFPAPWLNEYKFWPHVARVDNAYGDRNLMCTCLPVSSE